MANDDEGKGPGDAKIWVGSMFPDKIFQFCQRLVKEPDKVDPIEIELFISQTFVGEAEADAWLRYLADLRTQPTQDYRDAGSDGKVHRYRIDWSFNNPAVQDSFFKTLFNELRKNRLKMDQITALAYSIGSWRREDDTQVKHRQPPGWHL